MIRTINTARDMREVQEKLDDLERRQRQHSNIIRPNRRTRYDRDLVSRREVDDAITVGVGGIVVGGTPGGSSPEFQDLTPMLTETGTSWTLASLPISASTVMVFLNGQQLRRVSAAPTVTQFSVSDTTVTTGHSLLAGERLFAIYEAAGERMAWQDLTPNLTETGTAWTLAEAPAIGKISVFLNGAMILKVTAAPTASQYTQSGVTVTTGRSLVAGERLYAFYSF